MVLQILILILGISLSFQINDWNENVKNRVKVKKLLFALKIEFVYNLHEIDTVLYYTQKVMDASRKSLDIIKTENHNFDQEHMDSLTRNLEWIWTFDPDNGALRSGFSSGTINLISSDSLRYYLFGWEATAIDLDENEIRAVDHQLRSRPIFSRHVRMADRFSALYDLPSSFYKSDYSGLYGDPLFEDYLTERFAMMKDMMDELIEIQDINLQILYLIDQELKTKASL